MSTSATSTRAVPRTTAPAPSREVRGREVRGREVRAREVRGRESRGVVRRWLLTVRAASLPATLGAGLVAGALAVRVEGFSAPLYLLALLGIVLAHTCTNLLDGLSERTAGLVPRRQVGLAVIALWLAGLAVVLALTVARGWPVVAFALAGAVLSLVHTSRPLRRRTRVLGELDVLLVWGPLMVAGTYVVAVGALPWQVWAASVPYGLLCATVLLGRHVDAAPYERPSAAASLPVRLGEPGARALVLVALVAFYATTGLAVAAGALPWPVLVVALALPRLRSAACALRRPRAQASPEGPLWPPSCAAVLLRHARPAGGLLVLGLLLAAGLDLGLPPDA